MDAAEKTLGVLDALQAGEGSRLGAIAERAGLPKSTVHRILRRLVERGYARAQGDGVYVLGPRILALAGGMLDQLNAGPAGRAVLRSLHADVGHTVHFAMLLGDEAGYVEKLVDPDLPYQTASRVGMRIALHCTSIGKALLAAIDDEENERNIRCVGSAVLDHRGRPAGAVSVSALTVELSYDDALALGPRVVAAAGALSEALGAGTGTARPSTPH